MGVSIIVPIYNTEKYLPRLIDSLINQSYRDLEIWLIDDGSTDSSGAICDEYATHDNRIHVFHQRNGGEVSARNAGLARTSKEYILFIDSDDEYTPEAVELLIKAMEQDNVDMIIGGFLLVKEDMRRICVAPRERYSVPVALKELLTTGSFTSNDPFGAEFVFASCGCKLYKSQIIREHGLRFCERWKWGNDRNFVLDYFSFCREIVNIFSPICIYYIYRTDERVQGTAWTFADYFFFFVKVREKQMNLLLKETDLTEDFRQLIYQKFIDELIRRMVEATVYEDMFDGKFTDLLEETVASWLVNEAIKQYKRVRIADSESIPGFILNKDIDSLVEELRSRAKTYVAVHGKNRYVRMMVDRTIGECC